MTTKISPGNRQKQFKLLIEKAKVRLDSAQVLLKRGNYNDAISRSYYAFFDTASALLISKGLFAKTHSGVVTLFGLHFIKTDLIPAKFARFFRQAKIAREEADYEALKKFTKEETQKIIESAKKFIDYVEKEFAIYF